MHGIREMTQPLKHLTFKHKDLNSDAQNSQKGKVWWLAPVLTVVVGWKVELGESSGAW